MKGKQDTERYEDMSRIGKLMLHKQEDGDICIANCKININKMKIREKIKMMKTRENKDRERRADDP